MHFVKGELLFVRGDEIDDAVADDAVGRCGGDVDSGDAGFEEVDVWGVGFGFDRGGFGEHFL